MGLPPYKPDGSLAPTPTEGFVARELMTRYGISKQTLYTRIEAVGVTGTRKGKSVYFDAVDVHQLDACHFHLSANYTLKDIRDERNTFLDNFEDDDVVDISPNNISPDHEQKELLVPKHKADVFALTMAIKDAIVATTPPPVKDPLAPYRMLREASREKYQLTSQSVREIVGLTQSTINSWGKEVHRNGFIFRKVGPGKWRIFEEEDQLELDTAA